MKNHDIIFDKREKRIGFIRANCTIDIPEYISTITSGNLLLKRLIINLLSQEETRHHWIIWQRS